MPTEADFFQPGHIYLRSAPHATQRRFQVLAVGTPPEAFAHPQEGAQVAFGWSQRIALDGATEPVGSDYESDFTGWTLDPDAPVLTETLTVRWDELVIHVKDTTQDTTVRCRDAAGRTVDLLLTDDHREALGGSLLDPGAEMDQPQYAYRAEYDSMVLGVYTTMQAARDHCEADARDAAPDDVEVELHWVGDESEPSDTWELAMEFGGYSEPTQYSITPVELLTAYDPDAEE